MEKVIQFFYPRMFQHLNYSFISYVCLTGNNMFSMILKENSVGDKPGFQSGQSQDLSYQFNDRKPVC